MVTIFLHCLPLSVAILRTKFHEDRSTILGDILHKVTFFFLTLLHERPRINCPMKGKYLRNIDDFFTVCLLLSVEILRTKFHEDRLTRSGDILPTDTFYVV